VPVRHGIERFVPLVPSQFCSPLAPFPACPSPLPLPLAPSPFPPPFPFRSRLPPPPLSSLEIPLSSSPVHASTVVMALGIELDAYQAACLVEFISGKNVAIFSSAGCGKSVLLRSIISHAVELHGPTGLAVCSWYGAAAELIGGQTLHSLFAFGVQRLEPGEMPKATKSRSGIAAKLRKVRVLVIDDVFTMTAGWLVVFLHFLRGLGSA